MIKICFLEKNKTESFVIELPSVPRTGDYIVINGNYYGVHSIIWSNKSIHNNSHEDNCFIMAQIIILPKND